MIEIIPTNTCPPDLAELSRRSKIIAAFSPWVQLDVGDGAFVSELSWPYREGQWPELEAMSGGSLPDSAAVRYEVHIMAEEPLRAGELFGRAGASRIIGHVESFADAKEVYGALGMWKSVGAEAGLAILLDTPFPVFEPLVPFCNVIQLMSIATLGAQGARFEERVIPRIRELSAKFAGLTIEVDGGVSEKSIAQLVRAGARRFGVGSAIMKAPDPKAAYEKLKSLAENAIHPVR